MSSESWLSWKPSLWWTWIDSATYFPMLCTLIGCADIEISRNSPRSVPSRNLCATWRPREAIWPDWQSHQFSILQRGPRWKAHGWNTPQEATALTAPVLASHVFCMATETSTQHWSAIPSRRWLQPSVKRPYGRHVGVTDALESISRPSARKTFPVASVAATTIPLFVNRMNLRTVLRIRGILAPLMLPKLRKQRKSPTETR